jgi:hypothetical protein
MKGTKMNTKRFFRLAPFFALLATLILSGCVATAPTVIDGEVIAGEPQADADVEIIEFDVAEDVTRFSFDESKVFDDGWPTAGASFITQGYIYPKGTLNGSEPGVNEDGTPLYPDKVIGEWTCHGWLVGDGAHTESGPIAISTQIYQFGEEYGNRTIVSDGYELAGAGSVVQRAIVGGTGEYASARGEAIQTGLGMTEYFGVNLRLRLEVRK